MVNSISGHKHPAGASAYGSIAGDIWYRAQYMLQDQKIGHYMHVPPRAIFFSQIFGELIGVPINYGVIQWVLKSKGDYILGNKIDPLNQWTGQMLAGYNTMGVQYVLIGPKRLFSQAMFKPLPWAFLYGAAAPVVLYALHRAFPKSKLKFHLCTPPFPPTYPTSSPHSTSANRAQPRERHHLRRRRRQFLRQPVDGLHLALPRRLHLHAVLLPPPLRDVEALQLPRGCGAGRRVQCGHAAYVYIL